MELFARSPEIERHRGRPEGGSREDGGGGEELGEMLADTDVVEVVLHMSKEGKLNKRNPNQARA
jgi:hypothetical protein